MALTHKEKGLQIINKFMPLSRLQSKIYAKECSLIAVEQIIEEIEDLQNNCQMEFPLALEYWNKVKEEINSL